MANKKLLILSISLLALVFVLAACQVQVTGDAKKILQFCNDSDGGINFVVKGYAKLWWMAKWDSCSKSTLREYYCSGSIMKSTTYLCPDGCSNGACIAVTCTESDGGINYNKYGALDFTIPQFPGEVLHQYDFCFNSSLLIEYYCTESNEYGEVNYNCPDGCSNSTCINTLQKPNSFVLSNLTADNIIVTDAIPKYESGKDMINYDLAFNKQTIDVKNGKATIELGKSPVFIELDSSYPKAALADYKDSPFGIFAAFSANEFSYFKEHAGFTDEQYWLWVKDNMKNLGAHWTRSNLQLIWDKIEPVMGEGYEWNNEMLTDSVIKQAYASGANWLGVFHEGGLRGSGANRAVLRNPLDYPSDYGTFVQAVVERYDGDGIDDASPYVKVKYWQVGNEVRAWQDNVQDYIRFFRMVREAAKKADPEAKIVLVAPTTGLKLDPTLSEIIDILAPQKEFDVIDIHHWGTAKNWKMTVISQYRQILDSKSLGNVQIWSTEHGTWQGQPSEQPYQNEHDQAYSLIERYSYNLANGLDKLFWNNLIDFNQFGGRPGSIYNSMGLITDAQGEGEDLPFNTKRLSYYSYKLMTEKLEGSDWNNIETISNGTNNVYVYKFYRKDLAKPVYVAWKDSSGEESKQEIAQKPEAKSGSAGKCGDGVCGTVEKEKGVCPEDCG